jgi:hypothetical protein
MNHPYSILSRPPQQNMANMHRNYITKHLITIPPNGKSHQNLLIDLDLSTFIQPLQLIRFMMLQ